MKKGKAINIDTVKLTQEDHDWARDFLYPDLRKRYKLFVNLPQDYTAEQMVARAHAAMREEQTKSKTETKVQSSYSYTKNGKSRPMTEEERKDFNKHMGEFQSTSNTFFKEMGKFFESMPKIFKKK